MHFSAAFIKRPVMTTLLMAAFVIAGIYGYFSLPVSELPNVDFPVLDIPDLGKLEQSRLSTHPPRILLLYGSLRERSYSRFLTLEGERLLRHFGRDLDGDTSPRGLGRAHVARPQQQA